MEQECRVRLVFADELGRHVQRLRGFSSCWYLVPRDVKLVGDLAHLLLREFGLRKRCPLGLELRLEDLPVLATQSIRIVRDNDSIAVQCPLVGGDSSSSEEETERGKRARSNKRDKRKEEEGAVAVAAKRGKKQKKVKSVLNGRRKGQTSKSSKVTTETTRDAAKSSEGSDCDSSSSSSGSSSSSDSDSDNSDSCSSSSNGESDDEPAAKTKQKPRIPRTTTNKSAAANEKGAAVKRPGPQANADQPSAAAVEKGPRRKRRRLRNRPRKEAQGLTNGSNNKTVSETASRAQENGQRGNAIEPRGFPRAKAHFHFDEKSGDQVPVEHSEDQTDADPNWEPQHSTPPELAKYGPSSSSNQQHERLLRNCQSRSSESWSKEQPGVDVDASSIAPKRKAKGKYEERWKRPYEIVATVLDKKSEESSERGSLSANLSELLASYPSASPPRFQEKDILAFKTLTLCLETWQPKLSDWECGQVQTADSSGSTIELSSWTLEVGGANDSGPSSVSFHRAPNSESRSVQTSEISELRYLDGPTYLSLQQAGNQGKDNLPPSSQPAANE